MLGSIAEFGKMLLRNWYITLPVALLIIVIIISLVMAFSRIARNAKEDAAVKKARKNDLEMAEKAAQAASQENEVQNSAETAAEPSPAQTKEENVTQKEKTSENEDQAAGKEKVPGKGGKEPAETGKETAGKGGKEPAETGKETAGEAAGKDKDAAGKDKDAAPKAANKSSAKAPAKGAPAAKEGQADGKNDVAVEVSTTEEEGEKPAIKATYRVSYDKETHEWLVKKDGAQRVIRRTRTKAEAVEYAYKFAENQDLNISVQKKDGKFQKKTHYEKMISTSKNKND